MTSICIVNVWKMMTRGEQEWCKAEAFRVQEVQGQPWLHVIMPKIKINRNRQTENSV